MGTCSWLFLGVQESESAGTSGADDDSDAESDGYGAEGLSWEAVMESLQVRESVSPNFVIQLALDPYLDLVLKGEFAMDLNPVQHEVS